MEMQAHSFHRLHSSPEDGRGSAIEAFTLNLLLSPQADVRAVQNLALHFPTDSFSIQTTRCLSLPITNLQLQNSSEKFKKCIILKFTKFHSC